MTTPIHQHTFESGKCKVCAASETRTPDNPLEDIRQRLERIEKEVSGLSGMIFVFFAMGMIAMTVMFALLLIR